MNREESGELGERRRNQSRWNTASTGRERHQAQGLQVAELPQGPPVPPADSTWGRGSLSPGLAGGGKPALCRAQATLTLGLVSLAGEAAGLVVVAAGRLGGAAGPEPKAGLMGFLGGPPQVVGAGCLGREVDCVLAFDVDVFAG